MWWMAAVSILSLWSALGCSRCQHFNEPAPFVQVDTVAIQPSVDSILKAIRETAVVPPLDSVVGLYLPDAHAYYDEVYAHIVRCSHIRNDSAFKATKFLVANRVTFLIDSEEADAFYDETHGQIVLGPSVVWDRLVVGHEILHMLLTNTGVYSHNHPPFWFDNLCKDYVTSPNRQNG